MGTCESTVAVGQRYQRADGEVFKVRRADVVVAGARWFRAWMERARRDVPVTAGDGTYHAGAGEWSRDRARALRYPTRRAAEWGLDDVDCAGWLRDRLTLVRA